MIEHDERMLKAVEKIADSLSRIADAKEAQNQAGVDAMKNMPDMIKRMFDEGSELGKKAIESALGLDDEPKERPPEN